MNYLFSLFINYLANFGVPKEISYVILVAISMHSKDKNMKKIIFDFNKNNTDLLKYSLK